jgi:hypothetical protein
MEQLVDVVPLFRSDKIRLISVCSRQRVDVRNLIHRFATVLYIGNVRPLPSSYQDTSSPLARDKFEAKKEVSPGTASMALRR